jgi:hypothetical protein
MSNGSKLRRMSYPQTHPSTVPSRLFSHAVFDVYANLETRQSWFCGDPITANLQIIKSSSLTAFGIPQHDHGPRTGITDYRHLCGSESRRAYVLVGIMSLSLLLAGLGGRRSQLNLGCSVARALVTGSGEDPWSALISLARLAESTVMIRVHHSRTITNFRFAGDVGWIFTVLNGRTLEKGCYHIHLACPRYVALGAGKVYICAAGTEPRSYPECGDIYRVPWFGSGESSSCSRR